MPVTISGVITRDTIIHDNDMPILQWVTCTCFCLSIDIFGTLTNTLNIICFVKQGFKDPVNISLLGLAISDLGCLLPLIWSNICLTPAFSDVDVSFDLLEFQYLTGSWPHVTFSRVSAWMTAFITLERCLCVTVPLKVKELVTPKRVTIIITCVFIILIVSVAPIYVVNKFNFKFYPERNKSLIGLEFSEDREYVETITYIINNVFISFSAFTVIVVCTIILVVKLSNNTTWRSASTANKLADNISSRNQRASKMVVMISILFIVCFVPVVIVIIAMSVEPEMSVNGLYKNVVFLMGGISVILESINSSVNIFIYYHMSSKYRATLRLLFNRDKKN